MTKKVLYFLAGNKPTGAEQTAIDKIKAAGVTPAYDLGVRAGTAGDTAASPNYGHGPEACDYVAGTPSSPAYDNTGTYPRLDVDNIPASGLLSTQAVIKSGVDFTVAGVVFHPTVVAGVITALTHTP